VKEKKLFSTINAYPTGEFDKSLFVIDGKLVKGVKMKDAEEALDEILNDLMTVNVKDEELEKVVNKVESTMEFSEMELSSRALNLAVAAYMGDTELVNTELKMYKAVTADDIRKQSKELFRKTNCSTLYYLAERRAN